MGARSLLFLVGERGYLGNNNRVAEARPPKDPENRPGEKRPWKGRSLKGRLAKLESVERIEKGGGLGVGKGSFSHIVDNLNIL